MTKKKLLKPSARLNTRGKNNGAVKVFCKDESKIEEILKYLLEERISFDIVGRQALLVFKKKDVDKLTTAENGWFEIEAVNDFPSVCWPASKTPFGHPRSIPDRFRPIDIPAQQTKPSRTNT